MRAIASLIFLVLSLAKAKKCKFGFKENGKELIEIDFFKSLKGYDFKSAVIHLPKLDNVFECIESFDDQVEIEVKGKHGNETGFTTLKTKTLQNVDKSEISLYNLEPLTVYRFNMKPFFNGKKAKSWKTSFRTGPNLITDVTISNISDQEATLKWTSDNEKFQLTYGNFNETLDEPEYILKNLEPCQNQEIEIANIFSDKIGIRKKTRFDTFPSIQSLTVTEKEDMIEIDASQLKKCNLKDVDILLNFVDLSEPLKRPEEIVFKEDIQSYVIGTEQVDLANIKQRMIHASILKTCANFKLNVTFRIKRADSSSFDIQAVKMKTVKSDSQRNLHFTESVVCSRSAKTQEFDESPNEDFEIETFDNDIVLDEITETSTRPENIETTPKSEMIEATQKQDVIEETANFPQNEEIEMNRAIFQNIQNEMNDHIQVKKSMNLSPDLLGLQDSSQPKETGMNWITMVLLGVGSLCILLVALGAIFFLRKRQQQRKSATSNLRFRQETAHPFIAKENVEVFHLPKISEEEY